MYFAKINQDFNLNAFDIGKEMHFFGVDGYGLKYSDIGDSNNHLFNLMPVDYRKYFYISFLEINIPKVPPHVDNEIITSINFYISTRNYRTSFYKKKNDNANTFQLSNQTNGCIYRYDDIELEDHFVAKDDDIYVLDVTKIHDVCKIDNEKNCERTAIALASPIINFKETINLLRLNNIDVC